MKLWMEALSYNDLLGQCDLIDETFKEFERSFWKGALLAIPDIAQDYEALHKEALSIRQQIQRELATRTLERIRTGLDKQLEHLPYEDDTDEKGAR